MFKRHGRISGTRKIDRLFRDKKTIISDENYNLIGKMYRISIRQAVQSLKNPFKQRVCCIGQAVGRLVVINGTKWQPAQNCFRHLELTRCNSVCCVYCVASCQSWQLVVETKAKNVAFRHFILILCIWSEYI